MAEMVTVACKIPTGLILRNFEMVEHSEPVMGGGTKATKGARQIGGSVKIHGCSAPFGQLPAVPLAGGYALTPNIDKQFIDEWMKQNAESDIVKNKLIFTHDKAEFVHKRAQDNASLNSGLQPLVPDADARIPRSIKTGDKKVA